MKDISARSYPAAMHPNVQSAATRAITFLPRYLDSPLHTPSIAAFAAAAEWLDAADPQQCAEIILDSGCGTGRSTRMLARRNPDAVVIGVDRSESRLESSDPLPSNALLVRAELASFWRLLIAAEAEDGILAASRIQQHFLLYPNPYPKASRLNLRWHGHAALPILLAIGEQLEVRSNWRVYLDEFGEAAATVARAAAAETATHDDGARSSAPVSAAALSSWQYAARRASLRLGSAMRSEGAGTQEGHMVSELHVASEEEALTAFERRYYLTGEPLYRLVLRSRSPVRVLRPRDGRASSSADS